MTRTAILAAALSLAGCSGEPAKQAQQNIAAAGDTAAPIQTAPSPVPSQATGFGSTSGLSGQTSSLRGDVTDFRVTVTETATVVSLASDTLFEFDKADLAPAAITNLKRTAHLIDEGGKGTVVVSGYTDAKGDDAYNLTLSQRRANAVVDWLKQQPGMAERQFQALGKGEATPVAPNTRPDGSDDPQGRARNRRVEVEIPKA